MTHSGVATGIQLTSDSGARTGGVNRFIFHHAAGTSLAVLLALFQPGGRSVSANYAIKDKQCILAVDEDHRAKTSGSISFDGRAVTVEVCNSTGAPKWNVSEESFDTLARLIADVATRHGFPINNDTVLGHLELKIRFNVGYATACPMVLYQRKAELLQLARHYQAPAFTPSPGTPAPAVVPKPKPVPAAGVSVVWIQERLRAHGFMAFVDGRLGEQTRGYIRDFQKAKGLHVDGIAGPLQTIPALAAAPSSRGRWLSVGSKGALVTTLQKKLKYGYPLYARHIVVDGNYGKQTKNVVIEFQRRAGLHRDGIAGEQTLKALGL